MSLVAGGGGEVSPVLASVIGVLGRCHQSVCAARGDAVLWGGAGGNACVVQPSASTVNKKEGRRGDVNIRYGGGGRGGDTPQLASRL